MLELQFKDAEEFEKYFFGIDAPKELIYKNIFEGVKEGLDNDLDTVTFAEISFDDGTMVLLDSVRSEWKQNLENCINYFIEVENFELCAEMNEYLKLLEDE